MNKKSILLEVICCLLIILFFYTGLSKLVEPEAFEFDLLNAPIVKAIAPIAFRGLPIFEMLVAISLIIPKTRKVGLYCSLALMIIFVIYVGGILAFAKHKPCTCGGVLRSMSWPQHLWFNIAFTILALIGIILFRKQKKDSTKKAEMILANH